CPNDHYKCPDGTCCPSKLVCGTSCALQNGQVCVNGQCCDKAKKCCNECCSDGQTCCNKKCIDTTSDPMNCGFVATLPGCTNDSQCLGDQLTNGTLTFPAAGKSKIICNTIIDPTATCISPCGNNPDTLCTCCAPGSM
ncbi:11631_t:CDS:2, partial [Racocetra persica]